MMVLLVVIGTIPVFTSIEISMVIRAAGRKTADGIPFSGVIYLFIKEAVMIKLKNNAKIRYILLFAGFATRTGGLKRL